MVLKFTAAFNHFVVHGSCYTSVGLAQVHPNKYLMKFKHHCFLCFGKQIMAYRQDFSEEITISH